MQVTDKAKPLEAAMACKKEDRSQAMQLLQEQHLEEEAARQWTGVSQQGPISWNIELCRTIYSQDKYQETSVC